MALSDDKNRRVRKVEGFAGDVANGDTVYKGSYLGMQGPSDGTSGDRGYITTYNDADGRIPGFGQAKTKTVGDTSASPVPEVSGFLSDWIEESVAVTGAATIADQGKHAYMTDDNTLTLTATTAGFPNSAVVRWRTSTSCDVYHYGFATSAAIALGGGGEATICLGSFDLAGVATTTTAANLATGIPMSGHGEIIDFFGMCDGADFAGTSGFAVHANLELGGTNLTGGTLIFDANVDAGEKVSLTSANAITAANVFHNGDLLDIEVLNPTTSSQDITTGRINLYIKVRYRLGI